MDNYKRGIGQQIWNLLYAFDRQESDIISDHANESTIEYWLDKITVIEKEVKTEKKKSFFKGFVIASVLTSAFLIIIMYI